MPFSSTYGAVPTINDARLILHMDWAGVKKRVICQSSFVPLFRPLKGVLVTGQNFEARGARLILTSRLTIHFIFYQRLKIKHTVGQNCILWLAPIAGLEALLEAFTWAVD